LFVDPAWGGFGRGAERRSCQESLLPCLCGLGRPLAKVFSPRSHMGFGKARNAAAAPALNNR
jgi:hypothetical protein